MNHTSLLFPLVLCFDEDPNVLGLTYVSINLPSKHFKSTPSREQGKKKTFINWVMLL